MKRLLACSVILVLAGCAAPTEEAPEAAGDAGLAIVPDVAERLAQFVPTDLTVDLEALSDQDKAVLIELLGAAHIMDEIFFRQVWVDNPQFWSEHLEGLEGPLADDARAYFKVNFGPWDRLAEFAPFIGDMPHPEGAGYYRGDYGSWSEQSRLNSAPQVR